MLTNATTYAYVYLTRAFHFHRLLPEIVYQRRQQDIITTWIPLPRSPYRHDPQIADEQGDLKYRYIEPPGRSAILIDGLQKPGQTRPRT